MIRRQIVVGVDPDRLWRALTDPAELADWFGGTVEWDLREGGPLRFRGSDGTRRDGRVEAVRPGHHLRFYWWPVDPGDRSPAGPGSAAGGAATADPDSDAVSRAPRAGEHGASTGPLDDSASEVTYVLVADGDGTRLTVQERPVDDRTVARAAGPADWTDWDSRLARHWLHLAPPLLIASGARY